MTESRSPVILLLGSFPPQAQGIPGYCGALARALAARGAVQAVGFKAMYPAFLFPGVKRAMDPTSSAPQAPGLTVRHSLAWYNPIGWLWNALTTPADIVHIQWWSLPLFPVCLAFALAARLRRLPVVVTVHNVLPHEPSPWFLRASRMLYRFADQLIVHSETNRTQLLEHFLLPADRVAAVPMGVDATIATPMEPRLAREQLGLDQDRPTLLFFGTIRPYKGLHVLLYALAIIRRRYPDIQLVVAGAPWEPWENYQIIMRAEGIEANVHTRLGHIPESEVPLWFAAADLVVLPYTHFDAQSAVGAQVLGHGRPLMVTACGGLPALVHGEKRWIAQPDDPVSLAVKLGDFLEDREGAEADFAAIARRVGEGMSHEAAAGAHWTIYDRMAAR
ncbi:MAG: glycosyltransferase family 4 protein [Candidatus Hydrogenedentes bacterium]|nr:glycosyltransferase family 4 protein [Candidatus Hydrogenedentota bacterium]